MGLIDFLFPKYCVSCKKLGSFLCADCFAKITFNESERCLMCDKPTANDLTHPGCVTRYSIDGCFASVRYDGVVKKLLYQFKYRPYLTSLHGILGDLFYEGIIQKQSLVMLPKNNAVLVPVPLTAKKLRNRGYNHAELLAKSLSIKTGIKVVSLLRRQKETRPQYGLTKLQRKENLKNAFTVQAGKQLPHTVFLVDDIVTTGTTFVEAANVLKKTGVKQVYALAFARD